MSRALWFDISMWAVGRVLSHTSSNDNAGAKKMAAPLGQSAEELLGSIYTVSYVITSFLNYTCNSTYLSTMYYDDYRYPGPSAHAAPTHIHGLPTDAELAVFPKLFTWGELKEIVCKSIGMWLG